MTINNIRQNEDYCPSCSADISVHPSINKQFTPDINPVHGFQRSTATPAQCLQRPLNDTDTDQSKIACSLHEEFSIWYFQQPSCIFCDYCWEICPICTRLLQESLFHSGQIFQLPLSWTNQNDLFTLYLCLRWSPYSSNETFQNEKNCPRTTISQATFNELPNRPKITNVGMRMAHYSSTRVQDQSSLSSQECHPSKSMVPTPYCEITDVRLSLYCYKQEIERIRQQVEEMCCTNYDGRYVWKIRNFSEHSDKARSGERTSILSRLFYSSPNGYKMRVALFLNGNGEGYTTHLSVYVVIHRGEYDALLKWPFDLSVVFCLYDQTGEKHHIIDKIDPDSNSADIQKPTVTKNIDIGIERFCPLSVLSEEGRYVRNNTMFFRVMLDGHGTPSELLSKIININLALPLLEQKTHEDMVRETYLRAREALVRATELTDQEIMRMGLIP